MSHEAPPFREEGEAILLGQGPYRVVVVALVQAQPLRMSCVGSGALHGDGLERRTHQLVVIDVGSSHVLNFVFGGESRRPPASLPVAVRGATWDEWPVDASPRVTWLGHSTLFIEVDGARVLTDPIWSEHDHYDHLVRGHFDDFRRRRVIP
jgi:hypothetical protein